MLEGAEKKEGSQGPDFQHAPLEFNLDPAVFDGMTKAYDVGADPDDLKPQPDDVLREARIQNLAVIREMAVSNPTGWQYLLAFIEEVGLAYTKLLAAGVNPDNDPHKVHGWTCFMSGRSDACRALKNRLSLRSLDEAIDKLRFSGKTRRVRTHDAGKDRPL